MSSVEKIRQGVVGDCVQVVVGRDDWRNEVISGPVREWRLCELGPVQEGSWCGPTNLVGWVKPVVPAGSVSALCLERLRL